jgi:hypothetical protein
VTSEPLSFFTVERGTATTAAALISPCDGRFRLLAAGSVPAGVEVDALLEDLAWRVARTDDGLLEQPEGWRDWVRLEVRTAPVPRVCVAAASQPLAQDLAAVLSAAGWEVAGVFGAPRPDLLALGELCLDPSVSAVAVGLPVAGDEEEPPGLPVAWDLVVALASMRDDLVVAACGPLPELPATLPGDRVRELPAVDAGPAFRESPLRDAARRLGHEVARGGRPRRGVDGRQGLRASIVSLAAVLDRRVEGIEVGVAAGSRSIAHPEGEVGHIVSESGALVPARALREDREAEAILRWSTLHGDPADQVDRLRALRLSPWREATGDGARLRLAALRAAIGRLAATWTGLERRHGVVTGSVDVVVLAGGAFASVPPPAAALALVDTLRRPGACAIVHDHARVLGPIGMLPDEGDRRRLLTDLLDDVLLPLGSAILTGELRMVGRAAGLLQVSTPLAQEQVPLLPGALRLVDLPPGITARVDLEARDGTVMGMPSRHVAMEVTGGLAGLLVDTRDIPLRLPESLERRRAALAGWERAAWPGGEA